MRSTKTFLESLKDGYKHLRSFPRDLIYQYRSEGVKVDEEGVWSLYRPIDEVRLEPFGEDGEYLLAIYYKGVLVTEKLHIKGIK